MRWGMVGAFAAIWTCAVTWVGVTAGAPETEIPVPGTNWTTVAPEKPFPLITSVNELPCAACGGAKVKMVICAPHASADTMKNKQQPRKILFTTGASCKNRS